MALTRFLDELVAGRLPEPGAYELLIGDEMARQLAVGVGDELVLVGSAADGSMANDLYTVAGVFRTGSSSSTPAPRCSPSATCRR